MFVVKLRSGSKVVRGGIGGERMQQREIIRLGHVEGVMNGNAKASILFDKFQTPNVSSRPRMSRMLGSDDSKFSIPQDESEPFIISMRKKVTQL